MEHSFLTTHDANDIVPVIVRAATIDFDEPPDRQRRVRYAIGEDRRRTLTSALAPRVKPWAFEPTLRELLAHPETLAGGDVVVRRDWDTYGYLELTIIEAFGPLPARYQAVSRLHDGERDLYVDALIDDTLTHRASVARVHISDPTVSAPS